MNLKRLSSISVTLTIALVIVFIPDTVSAANPLVPCNGTDCSFCDLVQLGSNVINWFFGLVFVLFGVMSFLAGFGLMTSGGNQSALDDAKKKLSNAVIGLLIVFSAWLIVDTLMKALLPDGEVPGFGPWYVVDCSKGAQNPPE